LSKFVETHPEAKSYYTLAATSIKFAFPPPGSLMGVRSNTRAILKMTKCTFTYPGRNVPSLIDVSCALSLSRCGMRFQYWLRLIITRSRVGIVGPNGAGSSSVLRCIV
jgi:elongation factor 3